MTRISSSGLDDLDMRELMSGLAPVASKLRESRILVTGASGWFGTWLLDALVALDHEYSLGMKIVAVSRDPAAFARRYPALHAATSVAWSIGDVRRPLDSVPGTFTHIIHAATDSSARPGTDGDGAPSDRLFDTIVDGTRNVLRIGERGGKPRVLIVSSGAVYGPQPLDVERIDESFRGAPDVTDAGSVYAEGKRGAELLGSMSHAAHGIPVTIARCFAFVGPHMPLDAHFAIGNFIGDALEGREIRVAGDGAPLRTYQYMTDLVVWLLTILVNGRAMRPYNVGGNEVLSIGALASACARIAGDAGCVRIEGGDGRTGRNYVPSLDRGRAELGLSNRVSLDDAIGRTIAWARRVRGATTAHGGRRAC